MLLSPVFRNVNLLPGFWQWVFWQLTKSWVKKVQQRYDWVLVYNMVTVLLHCIQVWLDWPESHWSPQSSVEMPASTESMQCKPIHQNLLMQINWHASRLFFWCESSGSRSFIHKFLHKYFFVVARTMHLMSHWRLLKFSRLVKLFPVSLLSCCLHSLLLVNSYLSNLHLLQLAVKQSCLPSVKKD